MKMFTQNLQVELKNELQKAEEIWIAVALLTKQGLKFIQENAPISSKQNYILGVDMPTEPRALRMLDKLQYESPVIVKIHSDKAFYHPKVYLIKSKKEYTAFVGSANCTKGGLFSNVELSFIIRDQTACLGLLDWYKKIEENTLRLSTTFIDEYALIYENRKKRKQEEERQVKKTKSKIKAEHFVAMRERKALVKKLKKYRRGKDYDRIKLKRANDVNALRKSLDYPTFNKVNVDEFFDIWALGHLIAIPKPTLKSDLEKFRRLLRSLIDENVDIAVRMDRVLKQRNIKGKYYIRGVSEALVSKVLTAHAPKKYFVKNDKSISTLQDHGLVFPRGLSKGQKYKATNNYLIDICRETEIENLAILDYYLYLESPN
ncbi:MAG: phospholipase D family protein [Bacteroidota bacterium]